MDRVRGGIAGAPGERLGLDDLHDLRLARIRLRVEDVDARGIDPRHDQIPPLHVRVRRVGAQARAAGVPAEMVQLVAGDRHPGLADQAAVALRVGVDVHDADRVGRAALLGVDQRQVGEPFGRRLHGHRR
jgi:hypothetical protein